MYAPVGGVVVAVNEALADNPQLLNEDPYGEGWLIEIEAGDMSRSSPCSTRRVPPDRANPKVVGRRTPYRARKQSHATSRSVMPTMPAITHVAVTVNDPAVSVPCTRIVRPEPVLDRTPDPSTTVYLLGNTLFGVRFPLLKSTDSSRSTVRGSITWPSVAPTAPSSRSGRLASTSWASPTAASSTPTTARACRSAILTTSRSNFSARRPERTSMTSTMAAGAVARRSRTVTARHRALHRTHRRPQPAPTTPPTRAPRFGGIIVRR
jgi:hypothetical protein